MNTATQDGNDQRLTRFARGALAVALLAQMAGLLLALPRAGTSIGTWIFLDTSLGEPASILIERSCSLLALGGSLLAIFARPPVARWVGAGVASAWFAALAIAETHNGGAPFTELALGAHATRFAAPLVLAAWDRVEVTRWLLRVSVSLTFLMHGFEALNLHPQFIDYLLATDRRLFGLGLEQSGAEIMLRIIGVSDVVLAGLVLTGRDFRPVLAWAAFWGVVTASSRVVQGGAPALHHTLIRTANGGLPFVLLLISRRTLMKTNFTGVVGRFARVALPMLALALPFTAKAQAIDGRNPAHLRIVWTEDPAHRATLSWSTQNAGATHEVYLDTQPRGGDLGAYAHKVTAAQNGAYGGGSGGPFYHHANVAELQPATTYYFVVVSDGVASPERHFVTAHTDDRPFRLLSGGDSRNGTQVRQAMNRLMAAMVEKDPGTLALAHGGDYIQSSNDWKEWNEWLTDHALTTTAAGRLLPVIPVRGNHEGNGSMFNEIFGFPGGDEVDYFVTKLGANTRMIVLDTNVSIGGDQTTWLEQQLQEAQAGRSILPNYHRPAYPAVKEPSGARQFWVPLFEQYNVDLAFESDGHVLKRTVPIRNDQLDPTGVVYVGEGGLGVDQRRPISAWYLNAPGVAKSAHHLQRVSIAPDQLVYEAIGMDGATVEDRYELQPRRAGVTVPSSPEVPGEQVPTTPSQPQAPAKPQQPSNPPQPQQLSGGSEVKTPATPEQPKSSCAAAGGPLVWAGLGVTAFAARRRRALKPLQSTRRVPSYASEIDASSQTWAQQNVQ